MNGQKRARLSSYRVGCMHSDLFNQEKLILNGADFTVNFIVISENSVCTVRIPIQSIRLPS